MTVLGLSQTLSLTHSTMLAYPDRVLRRVPVEWDVPLALHLPVLTDGLGSSQTLKEDTVLAYPDRVLSRVPVEWDVPLALHFPVLTDGVHPPLWRNPLLACSSIVEPVLLHHHTIVTCFCSSPYFDMFWDLVDMQLQP